MKTTLKIIFLFPMIIFGIIGMFLSPISYGIFILFNPKYEIPNDKAMIEVAPVTKWFWKMYEKYFTVHILPIIKNFIQRKYEKTQAKKN